MERGDIRDGFIVGCLGGMLLAGIVVMGILWLGRV